MCAAFTWSKLQSDSDSFLRMRSFWGQHKHSFSEYHDACASLSLCQCLYHATSVSLVCLQTLQQELHSWCSSHCWCIIRFGPFTILCSPSSWADCIRTRAWGMSCLSLLCPSCGSYVPLEQVSAKISVLYFSLVIYNCCFPGHSPGVCISMLCLNPTARCLNSTFYLVGAVEWTQGLTHAELCKWSSLCVPKPNFEKWGMAATGPDHPELLVVLHDTP